MRFHSFALAVLPTLFMTAQVSAAGSAALAECTTLSNQGKLTEAEPSCTRAAAELPQAQGKLLLADFQFRKGDIPGAVERYTEMLTVADLQNPDATTLTALAHRARGYGELGENGDAYKDTLVYLKHRPNDVEVLRIAAYTTHWNDRRIEFARRLIELQPSEMEFRTMLVNAYIQSGDEELAIAAAESALALDANSNLALTWRGFAYDAAEQFEKAERDHAAVVRRAPEDADPRVNRAETLIKMKRFADAIDSATDALRLNPDHFSAFMARAHARLGMGDGEGALADYQSARRISGNRFLSNIEDRANLVTGAQKAMTRESVASMEADRQTILAAVEGHLHDKCGHYRVPDYQDNENLNAYRDCVLAWSKAEDGELGRAIGAAIEQPVNRHYESRKWISVASDLRCSKMPKKSRCVDDTLYTRAEATVAGMDDPRILIGNAEWDRLNREVDVYNARLARADKVEKYVSFMQALSDALAEQSSQ